jgi:hypothetical protein
MSLQLKTHLNLLPSRRPNLCLKNHQQTLGLKCLKQNQDLSLSQQQSQRCKCLLRSLSRRNL